MRQRYIDKTQQDGICVTGVVRKQEGDLIWSHDNKYPLPETILDKLKELLGDGNASITIGADHKTSQNFITAGGFATVKLTCGQTMDQVLATQRVGNKLAAAFARAAYERSVYEQDRHMGTAEEEPEPIDIEALKLFEGEAPSTQTSKGKGKPTFRRK